ncbi:hypothetical protein [Rodentibacter haemolyticus]|uniref:Uncharacterized protein n=1 Tax=Rodentibacter haemolyticus TaxID=2778911 RepID=A0ABX6UYZ4_9PAST|nr:hypothetical protein [Rodentibacter haemolyticus]QPB42994.1 hypothetical protein IHV77_02405 [Rodentibacter haemolyticus]
MSTTLKVLSAKKVIASHEINRGEALIIEAREKSNYQLINDQTGLAPQNIIAKREGKDLKLFLEDGDMSEDIIIKNYYGDENSEETSNLVVGQHENGGIYAYVPESGLKSDAVSMLAEQVAAPQALGGEDLGSAFWAFNPWWLLALVPLAAGIAIAAHDSGGSGSNNNNNNVNTDTAADSPKLTPENNGSVKVKPGADNTKVEIKYTDEDGNEKTATVTKDSKGNWTSDDPNVIVNDDTFTIPADKVKDGSTVIAEGTDDAGNKAKVSDKAKSDPSIEPQPQPQPQPQDTSADKPVLTPENNGSVKVKPGADNTKVEIKYTDEDGNEKTATVTKDNNGNWTSADPNVVINNDDTFTIPADKVKDGSEINAKGTDEKGNQADADPKNAGNNPTTPRIPGDVDGDGDADDDDNDNTTEKGAPKVTVPEAADGFINKDEAESDGGVPAEVALPKNTKAGDTVTVTVTKPDGTTEDVSHVVTDTEEAAGKVTVTIPTTAVSVDGDYKVTAKVTTPDGQSGKESAEVPFKVDQTAPTAPDAEAQADGSVTVEPKDENPVTIKYIDETTGTEKEFTVKKDDQGNWTSDDKPANVAVDPATGKVTIPATEVKDASEVTAIAKDPAGNESKDTVNAGVNPNTDTTADAPTVKAEDNGGLTVTPGSDNTKVEVPFNDENDQPQKVSIVKDGDVWKVEDGTTLPTGVELDSATGKITIYPEAIKDNQEVAATGTDEKGNTETGKDTTKADTTPPSVDNTNGDGVVSSPATVNEGQEVTTTVKLTNNNGGTLPLVIGKDTPAQGEFGKDDFETPTFSNGVTYDPATGTITVPAGVKEFTITTKAKEDSSTEGTEKGKLTVGGVEGNEVTVNDTSADPTVPDTTADAPTVKAEDNGGLTVTPGSDNTKVEVPFNDENDQPQKVSIVKDGDVWKFEDGTTLPRGVTLDSATGKITIDPEAIKDNQEVTATGTDEKGNTETGKDTTKTDTTPPSVDNTNGDGVVSSPATVNEGQEVTTTVKLTNNNGGTLPLVIGKDTPAQGEFGKDDFETPTFSNGVTYDPATGTITVPAGVKEFTITTKAKEDSSTEGTEKGKLTVGGVEGNEVTVNDTSTASKAPSIDIDNIAGQAQAIEGTDGYAQFLPSNITTTEISNENGVVTKGFVISGTSQNVPADTDVSVTITANGETYFSGTAKVKADGTWSINVPTTTVTTTVTGSGEDEVTEVTTTYNNPKFDVAYEVKAAVNVDGTDYSDTDIVDAAPVVTDIYLQDNLPDDADVSEFYTDTSKYVGRIDSMADTDATKAISRGTGLTNDPSAELHFTLDKALKGGQAVKVLRYTIVDGNESSVEDLTAQLSNNGLEYTLKPTTPQSETTNAIYRYKVLVEDQNGVDLSSKDFTYRLDTIVEAMDVKELNSDTNQMILQADGVSEVGATIKYKYQTGAGESDLKDVVDNGDGTYTLDLANWNRKVNGSITLQVIDAAGNVSETKVNAVRNLFNDYTLEKGLNPAGNNFDDPLVTGLGPNVGGQSASLVADNPGTFASTNGNDTLIVGLDNFGGMGLGNGSVGRGTYVGGTVKIEMGAGDDHIQVRGTTQSMGTAAEGYFDMGEGNDKISFAGTFVIGNYNIRMGEGNNIVNFSGTTVQAAGLDISYGDGNDVLRADVNKDFAGSKTISFGNGDNYMEVGAVYDKNDITFGNGNDVFIAKSIGTKAPSSGTIDMGDGNDVFSVSGLLARQEVKLGNGDDVAIMGDRIETGAAWGRLDGGDGNDTLVLTKSDGKVSLQNVLNFEVIDLTAPTAQTIGVSNDYFTQQNDTTKAVYIKGGTNDTVDFGDNGKYINGTKFKDGGGAIKSNWNFWEKTESDVVHDGVTYDKYTYRTAAGDVNDEAVYIQQGIQII